MKTRLAIGTIILSIVHGIMPSLAIYLIYTGGPVALAAPLLSIVFSIVAVRIVPGAEGIKYRTALLFLLSASLLGMGVAIISIVPLLGEPLNTYEPGALITYMVVRMPFDFVVVLFRKRVPKQFQS